MIFGFIGPNISYSTSLTPQAQRDIHVLNLSEHLKAESWHEAYPLFEHIDQINQAYNLKAEPALSYYQGEVAFHLGKFVEAKHYLSIYVSMVGESGSLYLKSLKLISQIDEKAGEADKFFHQAQAAKSDTKKMTLLKKAANSGHATAQYELAVFFNRTRFRNNAQALFWAERSASQSYAPAQYWLGRRYELGDYAAQGIPKNISEALQQYRNSASNGSDAAKLTLGFLYQQGADGLARDRSKAISWYKKVALGPNKSGVDYRQALFLLGEIYMQGDPAQKKEAVKWYQLAANENCMDSTGCDMHIRARYQLASIYLKGMYVERDSPGAVKLLRSIAPRMPQAKYKLANMYLYGDGVPLNYIEAKKLYESLVSHKPVDSLQKSEGEYFLGFMSEYGLTGPVDFDKAMVWYKKIADRNFDISNATSPSMYRIGQLYDQGKGVPQNKKIAAQWYQRAIEARYPNSQAKLRLAEMYETGSGVDKNLKKSKSLYGEIAKARPSNYHFTLLNQQQIDSAQQAIKRIN